MLVNFIDFIEKPITKNNEFNSAESTQEVGVYSEVCHALALTRNRDGCRYHSYVYSWLKQLLLSFMNGH